MMTHEALVIINLDIFRSQDYEKVITFVLSCPLRRNQMKKC